MATVKKMKKAQSGDSTSKKDPDIKSWMTTVNKQIRAEMKNPALGDERRRKEDSTTYSNWQKDSTAKRKYHEKEGNLVERRPNGSMKYTVMPKKKNDGFKNGGKANKIKKAQYGESVYKDAKGVNVVTKTNTKDGPRYYKTTGPVESAARNRNLFNIKNNPADSVRAKDIDPIDLKKLAGMKNGGKAKKVIKSAKKVVKTIKKK